MLVLEITSRELGQEPFGRGSSKWLYSHIGAFGVEQDSMRDMIQLLPYPVGIILPSILSMYNRKKQYPRSLYYGVLLLLNILFSFRLDTCDLQRLP